MNYYYEGMNATHPSQNQTEIIIVYRDKDPCKSDPIGTCNLRNFRWLGRELDGRLTFTKE